jgi:amino acid transporter
MGVQAGSGKVFNWFANMTAIAGLLTWFGISVTYIRFYAGMKVQGIDRATLPFASRLQPYAAWYAAIWCLIICFVGVSGAFHPQLDIDPNCFTQFSGWSVFLRGEWVTADFITSYLPFVAFPILYLGARFWKRSRPVSASEMDFYTNIAEIEASTYDEPPPKNRVEAFWQWLVSDRVESFCMRSLIAFYVDVSGRYLR